MSALLLKKFLKKCSISLLSRKKRSFYRDEVRSINYKSLNYGVLIPFFFSIFQQINCILKAESKTGLQQYPCIRSPNETGAPYPSPRIFYSQKFLRSVGKFSLFLIAY